MMGESRYWVMCKKFSGFPAQSDFKVVEEAVPSLQENEFLAEALCWSIDPYNRAFANGQESGSPLIGFQVARITESKNRAFPVGSHVVGHFGWRTHTVTNAQSDPAVYPNSPPYIVPDLAGLPISAALGILGMPGMTAYFGLRECCKPKAGETLVITSAAGCVGSVVGQLGKILGLRVIGYAGTDEKVAWLKELGFDYAYNYKTTQLSETLAESAPDGVDCFFDNVGGDFALSVYEHMKERGRVAICGSISDYNSTGAARVLDKTILQKKNVECNKMSIFRMRERWMECLPDMTKWIREGKLEMKETVYKGFEQMPQAMMDQLQGKCMGKVVVMAA